MADNYLQEAFNRLTAMMKEAVTSKITDVDIEFWPYEQEGPFPYFTKRLGNLTVSPSERSEDIDLYLHTILLRMVVGHITEGQMGGIQDEAHIYIALVEDYLRSHADMYTDAGTYADQGQSYLQIRCHLESHTGLVVIENAGTGTQQISCEFTLRLPILRSTF